MEKTAVMSCQLTFYPLETKNINDAVNQVLSIIDTAPVQSETTPLNTLIFGELENIVKLLEKIASVMDKRGIKFAMQVSLSNHCGCKG
jgi:uncharacterized protein YqgV (UPF0045/DUF77 family)